jgi:hypothetical protein
VLKDLLFGTRTRLLAFGLALGLIATALAVYTESGSPNDAPVPTILASALWSRQEDPLLVSHLRFTFRDDPPLITIDNLTTVAEMPRFVVISHVTKCMTRDGTVLKAALQTQDEARLRSLLSDPTENTFSGWPSIVDPSAVGIVSVFAATTFPLFCNLDNKEPQPATFQSRKLRFSKKLFYDRRWLAQVLNTPLLATYHTTGTEDYTLQGDVENVRDDLQFGSLQVAKPTYQVAALITPSDGVSTYKADLDTRAFYGADFQWDKSSLVKLHEFLLFLAAAILGLSLSMIFEFFRTPAV